MRIQYVSLTAILLAAFAINLWLVSVDNRPPVWDYAGYLSWSLVFYEALQRGSWLAFTQAFAANLYRPPLLPLAALPFYLLLGTSERVAMLVSLVFLAIMAVSIYKLGALFVSPALGLVTAGIAVTLPGIIDFSRVFGLDFPLTAITAATFYLAIASKGFSIRSASAALGIFIGLGLMTKWSFIVFIAPILAAELIQHKEKIKLSNLGIAAVLSSAIALPWYGPALMQGLIGKLTYAAYGPAPQLLGTGSLFETLEFYARELYAHLVGPMYSTILVGIAVLSLAAAILRNRGRFFPGLNSPSIRSIAFSFLIALLAFTLLVNTSGRFVLPLAPILVALLVYAGWKLHPKFGPLLMLAVLLGGSLVSIVGVVDPAIGSRIGIYEPGSLSNGQPPALYYDPAISWPQPYDWKLDQIVSYIGAQNPNANVGILASHWYLNQDTLRYYAVRLGLDDLQFTDFRDSQVQGSGYSELSGFDFVLMKTGTIGRPFDTVAVTALLQRLQNHTDPFYSRFDMVKTFNLPDGSQVLVFMNAHTQSFDLISYSSTLEIRFARTLYFQVFSF
jgi:4-amino-4-deoxy-L-arabinose transferase-like glycosyltransferase